MSAFKLLNKIVFSVIVPLYYVWLLPKPLFNVKLSFPYSFSIWKSGDFLLARRSLETSPNNPANLRSTEYIDVSERYIEVSE